MGFALSILTGLMMVSEANGVSQMNSRTIAGEILDSRITACGVRIAGDHYATLIPFIEASPDLAGRFQINLTKTSPSGTSMTTQANAFRGGSLGTNVLGIDGPSTIRIEMSVVGTDGNELCRLSRQIDLGDNVITL